MNMNRLGYKAKFYIYEKNHKEINTALQNDIDSIHGVIVQGSLPRSYFEYLLERDIPVILINREPPEGIEGRIASVAIDTANIDQMINYLISLNHKKILYGQIDEYDENYLYFQRKAAAEEALSQWDTELDVELRPFRFNTNSKESLEEFYKLKEEGFTAAFCYNDVSALGLYGLIQKAKLRIPYDFSITGFDDIFASQLATPPLTTIRVNRSKLVSVALELYDDLIKTQGPVYLKKIIDTDLILRKSTFTTQ
jgi:DNA-binding LacI/PurR family transcriptional regulator